MIDNNSKSQIENATKRLTDLIDKDNEQGNALYHFAKVVEEQLTEIGYLVQAIPPRGTVMKDFKLDIAPYWKHGMVEAIRNNRAERLADEPLSINAAIDHFNFQIAVGLHLDGARGELKENICNLLRYKIKSTSRNPILAEGYNKCLDDVLLLFGGE